MRAAAPALPILIAVLALPGACAAPRDGYPSLAPRAIEQKGFGEPAAPPPPPVIADPTLDAALAAGEREARDAAAAFDAAAGRAATRVAAARGAPAGDPRWLDAHVALGELDTLRAASAGAVTTLEDLAIARAMTLAPAYPALEAARERARVVAERQAERIDTLSAALAPAG